jgi:lipopolysaccharide export system protein LptA
VTQKEQKASGDSGIFDMQGNTVTLIGNVIVTRGTDVLRGQRLFVDLGSGRTTLDSGPGRVEGLFQPSRSSEKR